MRQPKRKVLVLLKNGRHRPETSLERFYRERAEANQESRLAAERNSKMAQRDAEVKGQQIMRLLAADPTGALPDDLRAAFLAEIVKQLGEAFSARLAEQAGHLFTGRYKPIRGRSRAHVREDRQRSTEVVTRVTIPEFTIEQAYQGPRIS
ncbi:hypothetical protein [Agrobacterium vitis]|uniref:hypothetical protein n=1 Tax=Agrobacterium vitis TaxID=373 RepID=UPI00087348AA|nr:hypothetical protein [Agrobacterium vitis]MCM2453378.1 hypothetical protein [Agrobacterium vitis]MCM2470941.1 hypothetical protein [Agrobacterium vitis]MUO70067.1 hypothetical protein [Agrobacterium vitis]